MYFYIAIAALLLCAGIFAQFAGAVVAVSTELDQLGPSTAYVQLADALVKLPVEVVVLYSDGQEVLLEVEAIVPVGGYFAGELVVVQVNLLELAIADSGITFGDGSGELCAQS